MDEENRQEAIDLILGGEVGPGLGRDAQGHLTITDRGGGYFEVGGIESASHPTEAQEARRLIKAGKYDEAEQYVRNCIGSFTDAVDGWTKNPGLNTCLRDTVFSQGPTGAGKILQMAINKMVDPDIKVDGIVGPQTLDGLARAKAEQKPEEFLTNLREQREVFAKNTHDQEYLDKYLKGLQNRWDKVEDFSREQIKEERKEQQRIDWEEIEMRRKAAREGYRTSTQQPSGIEEHRHRVQDPHPPHSGANGIEERRHQAQEPHPPHSGANGIEERRHKVQADPNSSKEGLDYWDRHLRRDQGNGHRTSASPGIEEQRHGVSAAQPSTPNGHGQNASASHHPSSEEHPHPAPAPPKPKPEEKKVPPAPAHGGGGLSRFC